MNSYLILKYIHILSATFLFGTGIGTAFFMLLAYLSQDPATFKNTTGFVILADWIFTTPSVIIQPITGIWLMMLLNYPLNTLWFVVIMGLYLFAGLLWLIVVFIQYRLHTLARTPSITSDIQAKQKYYMLWWISLGIPAFAAILVIYWLMLSKWGIATTIF